jgi:hypothetical protein
MKVNAVSRLLLRTSRRAWSPAKSPFVLVALLLGSITAACGPARATVDVAGAATIQAEVSSTLTSSPTARVVIVTATPSPSATPTKTPVPSVVPSRTSMPAATPTAGSAGADLVVAFNPGPGAQAEYGDPGALLGEPDLVESPCCRGMVQLGSGGSVLLAFTDNSIADEEGPDFQVYGESAEDDFLLIELSADGQVWRAYPQMSESPGALDLADVELARAVYVRLTDLQPGTRTGAEVDAIVAVHNGPGSDLPPLTDAVARADLALREGPNLRMKEVGRISASTTLTLLGRSEAQGWVKVQAGDGTTGWAPVADIGLNVSLATQAVAQSPPTPTSVPPPPGATPRSGKRIAVGCGSDVCLINADATAITRLRETVEVDSAEWSGGGFGDPELSADGKWLVFSGGAYDVPESEIFVLELADPFVMRLTENDVYDGHPTWSPDGTRIAFESYRTGNFEIHVMNLDGSGVRNLTQDPGWDSAPAWSPDGTRIAFASRRTGNDDIYVVDADGSNLRRLSPDPAEPPPTPTVDPNKPPAPIQPPRWPSDTDPAWSPDGKRIAFASNRDGNWEIYVVNANGGPITRLTDHPETDSSPLWCPDGRHIVFQSRRDGFSGLYVMNADGTGVRLLIKLGGLLPAPPAPPAPPRP